MNSDGAGAQGPGQEVTDEHLFDPRRVPADRRQLGRFRLLHELGSGGMATLYLALDEEGRVLAVKQLHPHLVSERRFVEMFVDEAAIASRITHPNVCKVHGLERIDDQRLLMAMEYVHGESLSALCRVVAGKEITSCGPAGQLPLSVSLHLIGQACLGLHAAHELGDENGVPLGVVHRDISPQNLLVSYEGELKVVDFGIAAAAAKLHHTRTGTIKGKFSYMSPEQARGAPVDRRSDIFSLGAVLYEVLCGKPCFPMTNMVDTIRRVEAVDLVPAREHRPDLPAEVEAILDRALQVEPDARFCSAAAMYEPIYGLLAGARGGMTTQTIGDLARRIFARRYATREQLLELAFSAPEVLEQEELATAVTTAVETPAGDPAGQCRCEYCGQVLAGPAALEAHAERCGQRQWWEHNFGGNRGQQGAGDASLARDRPERGAHLVEEPAKAGLWGRLKRRFKRETPDPLVARLDAIGARLQRVRDQRTAELSDRAMGGLWGIVAEIDEHSAGAAALLESLKPKLVGCGNSVLALSLEVEANASYLASAADRDLVRQLEALEARAAEASGLLQQELERNVHRKRALLAERRQIAELVEVLRLRLEQMVDAVETVLGKVRQMASSPVFADVEASTQVTVLVDSLLLEVEQLGASVADLGASLG